ncbi:unnamed protein product [Penicillium pancosmium]
MTVSLPSCDHASVCFSVSPSASKAPFRPRTQRERAIAIRASNPSEQKQDEDFLKDDPETFPAPLMLPGDDLASDPDAYTQSFQDWKYSKYRNSITASRKTIYVMPNPEMDSEVKFLHEWSSPLQSHRGGNDTKHPQPNDIRDYLAAFYHGLEVKILPPSTLRFVPWKLDPSKPKSKFPEHIGLQLGEECHRIRTRPAPDNVYKAQLDIADLLSTAENLLPEDAFALVLLTNMDLYETEDDTFICGRAYGRRRVAIISSARQYPKHRPSTFMASLPLRSTHEFLPTGSTRNQKIPSNAQNTRCSDPVIAARPSHRTNETSDIVISIPRAIFAPLFVGTAGALVGENVSHCES